MALLDESERQDFWALIARHGYSKDDFELTELEDKPARTGVYAITGTVTVRRKSTGLSRQYQAGHATAWLADFGADLRGHVFGVV